MIGGVRLNYFSPEEFRRGGTEWLPRMDSRLLVMVDTLRHVDGRRIDISNSPGALGRTRRSDATSQHYAGKGRLCNAMDIIPRSIETPEQAERYYKLCNDLGFRGIGFYPYWNQGPGFHLDDRDDREPGDPATWGRVLAGDRMTVLSVTIGDAFDWFESHRVLRHTEKAHER